MGVVAEAPVVIITKYGEEPPAFTSIGWRDRGGDWTAMRMPSGWEIIGRTHTTSGRLLPPLTWQRMCIWMDKHDTDPASVHRVVELQPPVLPRLGQHVPGLVGVTHDYEVLDTRT